MNLVLHCRGIIWDRIKENFPIQNRSHQAQLMAHIFKGQGLYRSL